jgi:hypothetical protein
VLFDFPSEPEPGPGTLPVPGAGAGAGNYVRSSSGGGKEWERSGALQGPRQGVRGDGGGRFGGSKVHHPQRHSFGGNPAPSLHSAASSPSSGMRTSSGEKRFDRDEKLFIWIFCFRLSVPLSVLSFLSLLLLTIFRSLIIQNTSRSVLCCPVLLYPIHHTLIYPA